MLCLYNWIIFHLWIILPQLPDSFARHVIGYRSCTIGGIPLAPGLIGCSPSLMHRCQTKTFYYHFSLSLSFFEPISWITCLSLSWFTSSFSDFFPPKILPREVCGMYIFWDFACIKNFYVIPHTCLIVWIGIKLWIEVNFLNYSLKYVTPPFQLSTLLRKFLRLLWFWILCVWHFFPFLEDFIIFSFSPMDLFSLTLC